MLAPLLLALQVAASGPGASSIAIRAATSVQRVPLVGEAKRQARLVVVDAGHGGPDNGITGPLGAPISIYEKDVTLAVAKRLGLELNSRGLRVLFTRTTDTLIALSDRGRIANQAGGD